MQPPGKAALFALFYENLKLNIANHFLLFLLNICNEYYFLRHFAPCCRSKNVVRFNYSTIRAFTVF